MRGVRVQVGPEARVGGRERATSGGFTVSAPHAEINHAAYVACVCIYLCSCVYLGGTTCGALCGRREVRGWACVQMPIPRPLTIYKGATRAHGHRMFVIYIYHISQGQTKQKKKKQQQATQPDWRS